MIIFKWCHHFHGSKNWTKICFDIFFVQYMPHGNCSTAFVSQDIYQLLTIHGSMDTGQQLLHKFFLFK